MEQNKFLEQAAVRVHATVTWPRASCCLATASSAFSIPRTHSSSIAAGLGLQGDLGHDYMTTFDVS
jgi:hypothetical protein